MVTLTDKAVRRFKDILTENKAHSQGLRIFAAGGG
jgi:Fe-S cluster assembly iron-binding protein IscA